jgi:tetratricopeptide (TPR) repeat protein
MSPSLLPNAETIASRFTAALVDAGTQGGLWQIHGQATAGKSATLSMIADQLRDESSLIPILVAPPARASDAGPIGLMQIGQAMAERHDQLEQPDLERLRDPAVPWDEKLTHVKERIAAHADRVVLLCDDPQLWPSQEHYGSTARTLRNELLYDGLQCKKVVAGAVPQPQDRTLRTSERIEPLSDAAALLLEQEWGVLGASARAVHDRFGEDLNDLSPLHVRLLVAHTAVASVETASAQEARSQDEEDLATALLGVIGADEWEALREVWASLALVRRPFASDLLTSIGAPDLDGVAGGILRHCLLYERREGLVLHEILRSAVVSSDSRGGDDERRFHGCLAAYYRDRFAQNPTLIRVTDEMEAFHHATRGDEAQFDELRPFFTDQLGGLAFELSRWRGDYRNAAWVYDQILRWDPLDDYAHHYKGWNLDVVAEDPATIEAEYREALRLEEERDRWHASLINFCLARGRNAEARELWEQTRRTFEAPDGDLTREVVQNLHLKVARHLLDLGDPDFGLRVLGRLPDSMGSEVPGIQTVYRKLRAMQLARDHGNFVPGYLLEPEWWIRGPFLVPVQDDDELVEWIAGEVESLDDDGISLHAAFVARERSDPPETGPMKVTPELLAGWDGGFDEVQVGDFVEIVTVNSPDGRRTECAVHPQREWDDSALPEERPHPQRYVMPVR